MINNKKALQNKYKQKEQELFSAALEIAGKVYGSNFKQQQGQYIIKNNYVKIKEDVERKGTLPASSLLCT